MVQYIIGKNAEVTMTEGKFKLKSEYQPTGDQPEAIKALTEGILAGERAQTLLGVTGSGKTFTMANVIANLNRPTLVLAHNKTLAAQLCTEFRSFFPENAVEYFVSYYDYYQPEAYIPGKDMYIEKDAMINDEIDMLRHSATSALFERRDVIIVASVSCIYTLGDPMEYHNLLVDIREGQEMSRDELIRRLVSISYERNDVNFVRNKFRVRGDVVEIFPANANPIKELVAAVSVGIIDGVPMLDLCYEEDSNAEVDMNVVMTESGKLVEVQGTAEGAPFSRSKLNELIDLAECGLKQIFSYQREILEKIQ